MERLLRADCRLLGIEIAEAAVRIPRLVHPSVCTPSPWPYTLLLCIMKDLKPIVNYHRWPIGLIGFHTPLSYWPLSLPLSLPPSVSAPTWRGVGRTQSSPCTLPSS